MIKDLKKQKQKNPQKQTKPKKQLKAGRINTQYTKEKIKFRGAAVTVVLDLLSPKN